MLGLGRNNLHSAVVAWARILLPLVALAMLATLFMVSRPVDPEDAIPYARVEIEDRLREPRLTGATLSGVTQDGANVTLKADEAVPAVAGQPGTGLARGLSGRIETPDGIMTDVTAAQATLESAARAVALDGGVSLHTSQGYVITTDAMILQLDETRLESQGPVQASAPLGQIEAGKMVLSRDETGQYKLDFSAGVHLIYLPPSPE